MWIRCPQCKATIFRKEAESRFNVCPECSHHFYLPARERISLLLDKNSDFFEVGLWAAYHMYQEWGNIAAAGTVAGIGDVADEGVVVREAGLPREDDGVVRGVVAVAAGADEVRTRPGRATEGRGGRGTGCTDRAGRERERRQELQPARPPSDSANEAHESKGY